MTQPNPEIISYNYDENELFVVIDGEPKLVKLSDTTKGCMTDNILLGLKERTYIEL